MYKHEPEQHQSRLIAREGGCSRWVRSIGHHQPSRVRQRAVLSGQVLALEG